MLRGWGRRDVGMGGAWLRAGVGVEGKEVEGKESVESGGVRMS